MCFGFLSLTALAAAAFPVTVIMLIMWLHNLPIIWHMVPRPQSRIYDVSLQDLLRPWVRSCIQH